MPKMPNQGELDAILQGIALFPDGATIEQINQTLIKPLLQRTLQRRITCLSKQGYTHLS